VCRSRSIVVGTALSTKEGRTKGARLAAGPLSPDSDATGNMLRIADAFAGF
jgi:hypothetical protein